MPVQSAQQNITKMNQAAMMHLTLEGAKTVAAIRWEKITESLHVVRKAMTSKKHNSKSDTTKSVGDY